jgi:hypothetical protein
LFKKHIKENCHENINQIFVKVVIKIFKQHMDEYYSNKLFTLFLSIILLNYITFKKLLAMNDTKKRFGINSIWKWFSNAGWKNSYKVARQFIVS